MNATRKTGVKEKGGQSRIAQVNRLRQRLESVLEVASATTTILHMYLILQIRRPGALVATPCSSFYESVRNMPRPPYRGLAEHLNLVSIRRARPPMSGRCFISYEATNVRLQSLWGRSRSIFAARAHSWAHRESGPQNLPHGASPPELVSPSNSSRRVARN